MPTSGTLPAVPSSPADDARQRRALGDFLRAHRERLTPAAVGLPLLGRRRTPGLRREEVAQLCGLSSTWYTWIEQAREVSISAGALASVASALRLSRAERAYLFDLAGKRDPERGAAPLPHHAAAQVQAAVAAVAAPAYALDRCWDVLAWNDAAADIFRGWLDMPGAKNLLRYIFLDAGALTLIQAWESRARRVVAEFRAECSAYLDDTPVRALTDALQRESSVFAALWSQQDVVEREGGRRGFHHPVRGDIDFAQVTFRLSGHDDVKLVMLLP
ncbi:MULTISPECIES: helix-turn-helix transcriptional regulator [Pandoraea]|uniref:helix-turn-helix transcriptional regulator n=1 Tax=Pandoraea TaxID=93217 RepID=UPI00033131E6|nr:MULTISPECIES: helix-turn-helix transcriptional regulator [Pandoraea]EON12627.1 XRE family transcriptional regulator [Pandoraea sp. SD6-2]MDM8359582.1 helix-turn-helix transcriptional regulator [Pandoraea communis]